MSQPKASNLPHGYFPTLDDLERLLPRPISDVAAFALMRSLWREAQLVADQRQLLTVLPDLTRWPRRRRP
jgi:hypothetical protein